MLTENSDCKPGRELLMKTFQTVVLSLLCLPVVLVSAMGAEYEMKTIIEPGPFHGVHGLAFGPDGALYAGDIMGSIIHRVDIASGAHEPAVSAPFGMADDIGFAPKGTPFEGTLVWTSVALGQLYAQPPGGKPRLIADKMPSINTVGFAPDGRLYVTQTGGRHKTLWQVDLSGDTPLEQVWDGTGGLNGFTIADDGYLYGPQADLGRVIRFDLETKEIEVVADGFEWPTAVEIDDRGLLYVLDFDGGTVTRVNKETGEKTQLASLESGLDNMAIGPPGHVHANKLYVSSIGGNGIYEIDTATDTLRTVVAGDLTAPGGVATLGTGTDTRIYIADMFSLREINPADGNVRTVTPVSGSSAYPTTVTHGRFEGRDVVVTASWFTGRVQILDPETGTVLRNESRFSGPRGIAMLTDGSLLVAESTGQRIIRVNADGERTTVAEGFAFPSGLALAGDTIAYVSDSTSGTVSSIDLTTGAARVVGEGFKMPEGMAILPNGNLAIVDSVAKAVYELDTKSGLRTPIHVDADIGLTVLPPQPDAWIFNGIAIGPNGTLYLPLDINTSLVALTPTR